MDTARITANLAPGYSLSQAASEINKLYNTMSHKDSKLKVSLNEGGRIKAYQDLSGTMLGLFILALVFIYLVLAAQFESFVDPFIILLTVP